MRGGCHGIIFTVALEADIALVIIMTELQVRAAVAMTLPTTARIGTSTSTNNCNPTTLTSTSIIIIILIVVVIIIILTGEVHDSLGKDRQEAVLVFVPLVGHDVLHGVPESLVAAGSVLHMHCLLHPPDGADSRRISSSWNHLL